MSKPVTTPIWLPLAILWPTGKKEVRSVLLESPLARAVNRTKKPLYTHGYKEIEMAVFEYIKLITTKHYEHLCIGIDVTQEDCGSQVLVRLDTNLVSRSDATIRDIKIKHTDAVANFDENAPVQ